MRYQSTRGGADHKTFRDVLTEGLAHDGGLYVPSHFPALDMAALRAQRDKPYVFFAEHIMRHFVGDDMTPAQLNDILNRIYNPGLFQDKRITPMVTLDDNLAVLELFHGPTLAFKDVALQLLGALFDHALENDHKTMTIIGATSGDTGSAAIEGVKNCKNARIFILHPHNRTSEVQRRQMTTVIADNVFNIAVEGSFDDCQNIVKDLFNDQDFRNAHHLSAVNSINWARVMAQIVYYVYAAAQYDTPVRFAVPTGNFGNIYAAYVAKRMGVPIDKLIIGSNRNDILTRFFKTGIMAATTVEPSLSPSMDIQISSNLERYLFDLFNRDAAHLSDFMNGFKQTATASVPDEIMNKAREIFAAYKCDDDMTLQTITDIARDYHYVCDPHTAVGVSAALQYRQEFGDDGIPTIALACAHPAKFPDAVERATGERPALPPFLADLLKREERYSILPADTDSIREFINRSSLQT